jgi:hypothetical protein
MYYGDKSEDAPTDEQEHLLIGHEVFPSPVLHRFPTSIR